MARSAWPLCTRFDRRTVGRDAVDVVDRDTPLARTLGVIVVTTHSIRSLRLRSYMSGASVGMLDQETLPQNSDAVLVPSRRKTALKRYKGRHYGYAPSR